jgi:GT2 family glycosyltransferase
MTQTLVVICTFNPVLSSLRRTLEGLRRQSLSMDSWSLLIIDNGSTNRFEDHLTLHWHPNASIIREPKVGIAAARKRAYEEFMASDSELMLFVDDDTILHEDFLKIGLDLAGKHPDLGCWGGQLLPEYEAEPPHWFHPFLKYLAIFPLDQDLLTSSATYTGNNDVLPPSAGMFLRKSLASRYLHSFDPSPLRELLGARGEVVLRGEDTDLALCALAEGFQVGRFRALRLLHLIPASRVTLDYLARLLEGVATSGVILRAIHGRPLPQKGPLLRLRERWQVARLPKIQSTLYAAQLRGERAGLRILKGRNF